MRNVIGLGAGFAIGQGSVFAALSLLLASGRVSEVAGLGIAVAAITLLVQITDWGMITVMAKSSAILTASAPKSEGLKYINPVVIRAGISLPCILFIYLSTTHIKIFDNQVTITLLQFSVPAIALGAFNIYGYLDGAGMSGVSGLISSTPWLGFALPLFLGVAYPIDMGMWSGLGYSAGSAISLVFQFIAFRKLGLALKSSGSASVALKEQFAEGASVFLAWLPGQISSRAQIFAAALILAPSAVAGLVYVRQILNAANQVIYFFRRSEFPGLAKMIHFESSNGINFRSVFNILLPGFAFSILLFTGLMVASYFGPQFLPGNLGRSTHWLSIFAPLVLTTAITGSLGQILLASGMAHKLALYNYASVTVGLIMLWPVLMLFGMSGLVLASIVQAGIQCSLFSSAISKYSKRSLGLI